jgi:glycerol-3-phosphate acyltransferase PlsX
MKIGIDIMGGDFAPDVNVVGAFHAMPLLPENCKLVFIGNESVVRQTIEKNGYDPNSVEFVHTEEIITMSDHPTKAIAQKPNSSIAIGFDLLAAKKIDAFASTGNTGAMLVGSIYKIGPISGIARPCITSVIPQFSGKTSLLLDVGSNADCKPDTLAQFAILGSMYMKHVHGVEKPRVALLNIGEEAEKGNILTIATHKQLKSNNQINFIGNLEGRDVFLDKADVVVCDGFTGNIVLKTAEGFYTLIRKRGIKDEYFDRFNYENYGGTPVLGVNENVIIGHGISNEVAIKNLILHTVDIIQSQLPVKIKNAFN